MKQTEIDALAGSMLNNSEISRVKRIILDQEFDQTKLLCANLILKNSEGAALPEDDQSELRQMRAYLIMFFDKTPDGTTKIKGGKRGTDFDTSRDKEEIRQEVRRMLGLPAIVPDIAEQLKRSVRSSSTHYVDFINP
jgi:hypothetical protein